MKRASEWSHLCVLNPAILSELVAWWITEAWAKDGPLPFPKRGWERDSSRKRWGRVTCSFSARTGGMSSCFTHTAVQTLQLCCREHQSTEHKLTAMLSHPGVTHLMVGWVRWKFAVISQCLSGWLFTEPWIQGEFYIDFNRMWLKRGEKADRGTGTSQ